jgi:hypothetical protein
MPVLCSAEHGIDYRVAMERTGGSMTLSVIGAGYGRTGTLSLKAALEQLGYDKCHHMIEVLHSPGAADLWLAAARKVDRGEAVEWEALLTGYQAAVDWPACHFYRQLAEYYPQAKVILTVRDPLSWYQSMAQTTLKVIQEGLASGRIDAGEGNLGTELVVKAAFDGILDDPAHGIAVFERHVREVKTTIAPERLLVFDVREGWAPLCAFLARPVPDTPFPRTNARDEFHDIFFGSGSAAP